jgi:23S rRNA (uracil1939-C5)-methyltransferase
VLRLTNTLSSVSLRNLYLFPISTKDLEKYSCIVLNPPRQGAKKQCVNISLSNVESLIYISCDPKSFSRDARILINGGYKLEEITPIDQFYWNSHLEIVGLFTKY